MGILNFNLKEFVIKLQSEIEKVNEYALIYIEEYPTDNLNGAHDIQTVLYIMIDGNKYRLYHSLLDTQYFYDEEDFLGHCLESFDEYISNINLVKNKIMSIYNKTK